MRLLINHSAEDKPFLLNLIPILKQHGHTGAATAKTLDITTLQATAEKAGVSAILLSNPETLKALLGEDATLENYRGSRLNYKIPVLVINPLAHIHSIDYGKWLLNSDIRKLKRIKEPIQQFTFEVTDNEEKRAAALEFLSACIIISHDIETNKPILNKEETDILVPPDITCISFCGLHKTGIVKTFVVPFIDFEGIHYACAEEMEQAIQFMRIVLALPATKTAWNGSYDTQYEIRYGAWPENWTLDGMILFWSEYSELPRAIEFAASIHCPDYIYWKGQSEKAKKDKDNMSYWGYCGQDSWYSLRILLSLLADLKEHQIHNYKRTFRQVYPDLYCAFEGFKVDTHKREMVKVEAQKRADKYLADLQKMTCNVSFNPNSYKQVHHFMYEVIGASKPAKMKGAGTDFKVLNRISMQHPLIARIADLIIKYREEMKAINNTYSFVLMNERMLYNMDCSGAETARKACSRSNFYCGSQIQNQPPYAKVFLIADPGYGLIERDNNKSEARCVGYLAKAEQFIKDIEDMTRDFYKVVSERFFGIPYNEVSLEIRNYVTKHIIHGTHHMGGANQFINTATPQKLFVAMSMLKAQTRNMETFAAYLMKKYIVKYPEIKDNLWKEVKEEIRATGRLVSPLGWTRICFGDVDKHHGVLRSGVAHMSQNLSVDIVNDDYCRAYKEIVVPSNGEFRLKAQVHDSIVAQAPIAKLAYYAKRLNDIKPGKIIVHGREMFLPTDTKVGNEGGAWKDIKEIKFA